MSYIAHAAEDLLSIRNINFGVASSENFTHSRRVVTPMNMLEMQLFFKSRKLLINTALIQV